MSGGDYSQLADRLLAQGAVGPRPPTCGIHGDPIVDRRCPTCDIDRWPDVRPSEWTPEQRAHVRRLVHGSVVTPSTYDHHNADQATNQ